MEKSDFKKPFNKPVLEAAAISSLKRFFISAAPERVQDGLND